MRPKNATGRTFFVEILRISKSRNALLRTWAKRPFLRAEVNRFAIHGLVAENCPSCAWAAFCMRVNRRLICQRWDEWESEVANGIGKMKGAKAGFIENEPLHSLL